MKDIRVQEFKDYQQNYNKNLPKGKQDNTVGEDRQKIIVYCIFL